MSNKVLRVYPLEKKEDEVDPTHAGISMPVGSEAVGVIPAPGNQYGILVLQDLTATVRVWHPVVVAVMDQPIMARLGRTLGKPIGFFPVQGVPAAVIPDLPWPTSTIEAIKTQGVA